MLVPDVILEWSLRFNWCPRGFGALWGVGGCRSRSGTLRKLATFHSGKGFCCPKVERKTKKGGGGRERERKEKNGAHLPPAFCWDFCPETEAQSSQRAHLCSLSWGLDLDGDLFSPVAWVLFSPGPTPCGVLSLEPGCGPSPPVVRLTPSHLCSPLPSDLVLLPESFGRACPQSPAPSGSHRANERPLHSLGNLPIPRAQPHLHISAVEGAPGSLCFSFFCGTSSSFGDH